MATGEMECKLDFSCAFSFFPEKCPWEIFALICSPACSITGVIRIHFKPWLNGICQHSESFLKGFRLCEALGFPEAPAGQRHQ